MRVTAIAAPWWMPILSDTGRSGWSWLKRSDGVAHVERRGDGAGGVGVGGHDRVADGLHHRAAVAHGGLAQPVEMLLDQLEGVEIADPLVERGRALDVGEQERDVADREALRATDHLGAEQALERLAGEQVLAGEIGVEVQEAVVLRPPEPCRTATTPRLAVGFAISSTTGPGASATSSGS